MTFDSMEGETFLYLCDQEGTGLTENLANGVYGYTIQTYDLGGNEDLMPDITFGGLTFGASRESVLAIYGNHFVSNYIDNITGAWSIVYDADEAVGLGEDFDLSFYSDEFGVYEVSLDYYG